MATPYPSIAIVSICNTENTNNIELISREFFEFNKEFEMNFLLLRVIRINEMHRCDENHILRFILNEECKFN